MKIALQVFATRTGLGYQTRGLYRNLHPERTMLLDIAHLKGVTLHRDWYGPEVTHVTGVPADAQVDGWLDSLTEAGVDIIFTCETPLNYRLFAGARERGIRTILQYNWEFLDYAAEPDLPRPTILAAPAPWNLDKVPFGPVRELPVPVDPAPARRTTRINSIIHIAGIPTAWDRNGTFEFLDAAGRCRDLDVTWTLFTQAPRNADIRRATRGAGHVQVIGEVAEPADLYHDGDLLVLPRKYGGLCIPEREALVRGIPVLMTDIPPNNARLPPAWLATARWTRSFRARPVVDVHTADVTDLTTKIRDVVADPGPALETARRLGAGLTWDDLLPAYHEFFEHTMELPP